MINKVILVGNTGGEPEVKTLESGTKVARLRLATTERIYNRTTQETREHTEWHSVTLWGGLADVADKYVRKGSRLYVEGAIRANEWVDRDGNKRYGVEIIARDMKLLDRRPVDDASTGSGSAASTGSGSAVDVPWASPVPTSSSVPSAFPAPAPADDPDDLPF